MHLPPVQSVELEPHVLGARRPILPLLRRPYHGHEDGRRLVSCVPLLNGRQTILDRHRHVHSLWSALPAVVCPSCRRQSLLRGHDLLYRPASASCWALPELMNVFLCACLSEVEHSHVQALTSSS